MTVRARLLLSIAVLAVGTTMLAGCAADGSGPHATATSTSTAAASAAASAAEPVVVAIGDSIMKGNGLSPAEAWPALLGQDNHWAITNLACDGAGFATTGDLSDCDDVFSGLVSRAVALHPALILISGSSNDLGIDNGELLKQTVAALQTLRTDLPAATIVGISTVWNDTAAPDQVNDINGQVRQAVEDVHGIYLDIGQPLTGHPEWLQSDDVHPTTDGQRVLATAIGDAIRSARLTL
ncbi:MAG: SGNH/GDSL hydrolase family protein [Lacisediminihabitans sp.]